jgi:ubiquinone/menaquinone biosynthesis C-methylase UbiE
MRIYLLLFMVFAINSNHLFAAEASSPPGSSNSFTVSVPTAYMDDPRRIEWQMPEKVLDNLQLKEGDTVADIGAGTGFFSMRFAKRIGKSGLVYALDVDESMVVQIEKRAKKAGLANVRAQLAPFDSPGLPKGTADLIFICDTYLFFENRTGYLQRVRESLKKGGRLAIVSFNYRAEIPGAPPRHKMISKEQTISEIRQAGFSLEADLLFLPYQDFLVFRSP